MKQINECHLTEAHRLIAEAVRLEKEARRLRERAALFTTANQGPPLAPVAGRVLGTVGTHLRTMR